MARRKREPIDPAELDPPEVIAHEIEANLRAALREISALTRELTQPHTPRPAEHVQTALDI